MTSDPLGDGIDFATHVYNEVLDLLGPPPGSTRPTKTCTHCGRPMGDYAGGYGSITLDGAEHPLCHPNDPNRPDCYRLVTVYHEPLGSRKEQP